jgi:hypothetical protein
MKRYLAAGTLFGLTSVLSFLAPAAPMHATSLSAGDLATWLAWSVLLIGGWMAVVALLDAT